MEKNGVKKENTAEVTFLSDSLQISGGRLVIRGREGGRVGWRGVQGIGA